MHIVKLHSATLTLTLDTLKLEDAVAATVPWKTFISILNFYVSLPFSFLRQSSIPPVGYRTLAVSTVAATPTTLQLIIPGNQGWPW